MRAGRLGAILARVCSVCSGVFAVCSGVFAVSTGAVLLSAAAPATASAADLTCTAPAAGSDVVLVDVVLVDASTACGVRIDEFSSAFARAVDAVAFARADAGGAATSLAHAGGVAAAETASGRVGAVSVGRDSVSIVSPDPGAIAMALSLTRGQTFVGTVAEGVRCDAGAGFAVNLTTGQVCISDGISTWSSELALP